jgi:hypothetical protein
MPAFGTGGPASRPTLGVVSAAADSENGPLEDTYIFDALKALDWELRSRFLNSGLDVC